MKEIVDRSAMKPSALFAVSSCLKNWFGSKPYADGGRNWPVVVNTIAIMFIMHWMCLGSMPVLYICHDAQGLRLNPSVKFC